MAPEMIDSDNYTKKVDIWALGVYYFCFVKMKGNLSLNAFWE